jgi:hypothetical protein
MIVPKKSETARKSYTGEMRKGYTGEEPKTPPPSGRDKPSISPPPNKPKKDG